MNLGDTKGSKQNNSLQAFIPIPIPPLTIPIPILIPSTKPNTPATGRLVSHLLSPAEKSF